MPPEIKIRKEMTDIFDNIHIHDVDTVALTVTWFSNKHNDLPVITAPIPPDNIVIYHRMPSRHGDGIYPLHTTMLVVSRPHQFEFFHVFEDILDRHTTLSDERTNDEQHGACTHSCVGLHTTKHVLIFVRANTL